MKCYCKQETNEIVNFQLYLPVNELNFQKIIINLPCVYKDKNIIDE